MLRSRSTSIARRVRQVVVYCAIACLSACRGPVSKAPIIEQYRAAACIPFSANPHITPSTREWETPLTLTDGSKVLVRGADATGGIITVKYLDSGKEAVAANAGDYVYPTDVRINNQKDLMFVKASGQAGGLDHKTWLFEYDLRAQRLLSRLQVQDSALPPECPEGAN